MLSKLTRWALKKSPWVYHVNTGACNNCDIEILDCLTPRFDVERFGMLLAPSPRHADVLLEHTLAAVTAVLLDFRAYDTLGEATVIFAAVIGVYVLLRKVGRVKA